MRAAMGDGDRHAGGAHESFLHRQSAVLGKRIINLVFAAGIGMTFHREAQLTASELLDQESQDLKCGYMLLLQYGLIDREIVEAERRRIRYERDFARRSKREPDLFGTRQLRRGWGRLALDGRRGKPGQSFRASHRHDACRGYLGLDLGVMGVAGAPHLPCGAVDSALLHHMRQLMGNQPPSLEGPRCKPAHAKYHVVSQRVGMGI